MPTLTAIYIDFQSPESYRAWRWLALLPAREAIEVRPYSLDRDEGERRNPWDRRRATMGLELLALGELAREAGQPALLRYCDTVFEAVHSGAVDLSSPEDWLEVGARAGLDLTTFAAEAERYRAEVGLWHQEAEDEHGVFATPSLVFDNDRVLVLRLDDEVRDREAARRLLAGLCDLATQPVREVIRTA